MSAVTVIDSWAGSCVLLIEKVEPGITHRKKDAQRRPEHHGVPIFIVLAASVNESIKLFWLFNFLLYAKFFLSLPVYLYIAVEKANRLSNYLLQQKLSAKKPRIQRRGEKINGFSRTRRSSPALVIAEQVEYRIFIVEQYRGGVVLRKCKCAVSGGLLIWRTCVGLENVSTPPAGLLLHPPSTRPPVIGLALCIVNEGATVSRQQIFRMSSSSLRLLEVQHR